MAKKATVAVSAPKGFSLIKSAEFPHFWGLLKSGKNTVPYFAPAGSRITGEVFNDARMTAEVSVVTQFFTTGEMTPAEKNEFTSAARWNLKPAEKRAFEALTTVWLTYGSGVKIEAANTWHLEKKAMRATDTGLVNLAQRLAGYLKSEGEHIPSQLDTFLKQYEASDKARTKAKSGGKKSEKSDDAPLKPSEASLVHSALEYAVQLSAQIDALSNGKVSKAQRDAMTDKLRQIIATLEPITAK